jgi:hypothetical protein
MEIGVFEVDDGSLGTELEPIGTLNGAPLFEVDLGHDYVAEVRVEDQRTDGTDSAGVIALPLNVSWSPPDGVTFTGTPPVPGPNPESFSIGPLNPLLTEKFSGLRFVDGDGSDGTFDNLRGIGDPIGVGEPEWFSRIEFLAAQPGTTCFDSELAGSMSFADAAFLEDAPPARACITVQAPDSASISGFVYADVDKDGERDVDESGAPVELGLPQVKIELYRDDQLVKTDFTGPDGWYHFEDLEPGIYDIVEAEQPGCFIDGTETPGIILPPNVSRGTAGADRIIDIELNAGEHGIEYNFGELGLKASCINKTMFLTSAYPRKETVYGPLEIKSTVVRGTSGNDDIEVQVQTNEILVTVNGSQTTIPREDPEIIVSIDAGDGEDEITLTGTDEDEAAHFQPTYFAHRNDVCIMPPPVCTWGYAVEAIDVEDVTVDADEGTDLGVIRDSTGSDLLTADDGGTTLAWLTGDDLELIAFERVRAISTRGGDDQAQVYGPLPYEFYLFGDWDES